MKHIEVQIGVAWDTQTVQRAIERIPIRHGLQVTLKGTLRKYPGCVHWHFKRPKQLGTIEATMWPEKRRVWLSVQSRRSADWIETSIETMIHDLQRALSMEH